MKPIFNRLAGAWTTIHGTLWAVLIGGLVLLVPRFEAIFVDFGVDLPSAAITVVRVSHVIHHVPAVVLFILIVGLGIDYLALKKLSRPGLWNAAMFLLPLLLLALAALSFGQVWLTIQSKLNG